MNEPLLTEEAKAAMRKYMLSLIVVPGSIMALLIFMIGYFMNNIVKEQAFNVAYDKAENTISQRIDEASKATSDAKSAKESFDTMLSRMEVVESNANTFQSKIEKAEAQVQTEVAREI